MTILASTIAPLLWQITVSQYCTLHTFKIESPQLRETHMQLREIHIAPGEEVVNASDQKETNVEQCTWFLF